MSIDDGVGGAARAGDWGTAGADCGSDIAAGDSSSSNGRERSKDHLLRPFHPLLGRRPDAEVARLARVCVRTVSAYRSRSGIPSYSGPRRPPRPRNGKRSLLDDFRALIGAVPDRVVADEAGMSHHAVRNFRRLHAIPASGPVPRQKVAALVAAWRVAPAAPAAPVAPVWGSNPLAWDVRFANGTRVVILGHQARDVLDCIARSPDRLDQAVIAMEVLGPVQAPSFG
jgi:hypothetical protein